MSKAFTKEDDAADPGSPRRLPSPLPPGARNYITPEGAKRLRAELDRLVDHERPEAVAGAAAPRAAAAPGADDRLQALDERIHQLRRSLESAVVVNPPAGDTDTVRFGASVCVRGEPDGEIARYRIVGVDEVDVERGWISWVSPIAKALLAARVGDHVPVALPSGEKVLEIVDVAYE